MPGDPGYPEAVAEAGTVPPVDREGEGRVVPLDWPQGQEVPPPGTFSRGNATRMSPAEVDTGQRIAGIGYSIIFRDPVPNDTADAWLIGYPGLEFEDIAKWEIKNPKGGGRQTIINRLVDAARKGQSDRVIIDVAGSRLDNVEVRSQVQAFLRSRYTGVRTVFVLTADVRDRFVLTRS